MVHGHGRKETVHRVADGKKQAYLLLSFYFIQDTSLMCVATHTQDGSSTLCKSVIHTQSYAKAISGQTLCPAPRSQSSMSIGPLGDI